MPSRNEAVAAAGAERSTLYVAIEISAKSWVVGIKGPTSERIGLHSLGAADVDDLKDLVERQRAKAERDLGRELRVLCCYEAGYEGFWLARWLDRAMSVETVVLDPASLLVNRKAKQRKTDRIDARKMVRALLAHDRGDAAVLTQVRIPSVEEEDRKRLIRERRRLVKERTSLTNSIKGLLKLHGVFDLQPRSRNFETKFAEVRTAYGAPFPTRARREILRLMERLTLVERQIGQLEAERDAVVRQGEAIPAPVQPEGRRDWRLPRSPTPWASGAMALMAWRWLRYQPESALCKWFEERTAGARGRIRRVMIVALARKLLIALWRFSETGLVPMGARCA